MKSIRDRRQQEFADIWLNHGRYGILNLCPRFGKIFTTINILEKFPLLFLFSVEFFLICK